MQIDSIFVVGAARSGGTLLYSILCADPALNPMLQENHFVSDAAASFERGRRRLGIEGDNFFDSADDLRDFYTSWIRAFLDRVRRRYPPARIVAIKSLNLSGRFHVLHALLPEARFIVTVRDPRDIAASMVRVGERQADLRGQSQYPRDMRVLSHYIMEPYQIALSDNQIPSLRQVTHIVRFEDLVANVVQTMTSLDEAFGLGLDPSTWKKPWSRSEREFSDSKRHTNPFYSEHYGQDINKSVVGSYKDILSLQEVAIIERECRPLMTRFDY